MSNKENIKRQQGENWLEQDKVLYHTVGIFVLIHCFELLITLLIIYLLRICCWN